MHREELEHAIRAACDVSEDAEVWVLGSQAILGEYPDAPDELRQSAEADVAPKNFPERVAEATARDPGIRARSHPSDRLVSRSA